MCRVSAGRYPEITDILMRKCCFVILIFAVLLAVPIRIAAHDGPHRLMGVVTMAVKDHLLIETPEGKELTIAVTTATRVLKGKVAVKQTDIKEGTRVVVIVKGDKPPYTASQVLLGVTGDDRKK
jgi:hypothetical protein